MVKRVLIVEDDEVMARVLRDNLVFEHFDVERASTAADAHRQVKGFRPEIVLLDLMLAEGDGFEICRALAAQRERPAIIILSARSNQDDKIRGLDLGADDYVTKPFAFQELLARMRAIVRRRASTGSMLHLGDAVIDFAARRAIRAGIDLGLSYREFEVLQYLADRPGRLVTRDELLEEVWGYGSLPLTRSVDISIARLRRKIEPDARKPRYIRTLHGEGYSLTPEG
jgi:DNA-binding response OmpR family regulator